jgi:hypothetical protein
LLQTIKGLGNLLRRVGRQFLRSQCRNGASAAAELPTELALAGSAGSARHGNPLATMIFRKKPGNLPGFPRNGFRRSRGRRQSKW